MTKTPTLLSTLLAALAIAVLANGCAIPHGSLARPARPVPKDTSLVGGGAMIPFAGAGSASAGNDSASFAGVAEGFSIVPALNYDYALDTAELFGVEVSLLKNFQDTNSAFGIFVNPRYEVALGDSEDRNFALTIDGNLGFFTDGNNGIPFFSPLVGVRFYQPIGTSGLVITQQLGTLGFFVGFPGSIAFDIAIPMGNDKLLHFFPEFRWDPNAFFVSDASGIVALFSAGLSFMIEL